MNDDNYYMNLCMQLADAAKIKGNAAAGCVLVKNDVVIATAEEASVTRADITCHAEIEVIRAAVKEIGIDLSGCTLYTTHEPCVMCAYPIRYYAVSKVVIQSPVKFFGSASSPFSLLTTTHVPPHWSAPPEIKWLNNSAM